MASQICVLCIVWVDVCLFVTNERQNGRTNRAQIFCGTSHEPQKRCMDGQNKKICFYKFGFVNNYKLKLKMAAQRPETGVHIIPFSIPFGIDKFERNGGKFLKWGQIVLKG